MKIFTFLLCLFISVSALSQKGKSYKESIDMKGGTFEFEMKKEIVLNKKIKAKLVNHEIRMNEDDTDFYMYSIKILNPFKSTSGKDDVVLYVKTMTIKDLNGKDVDVTIDLKSYQKDGYIIFPLWEKFLKLTSLETLKNGILYDPNTDTSFELEIADSDKEKITGFLVDVLIRLRELSEESEDDYDDYDY